MTRQRIKPDAVAQAQRFVRENAERVDELRASDSTRAMLDRLDHNREDFEEREDDDA